MIKTTFYSVLLIIATQNIGLACDQPNPVAAAINKSQALKQLNSHLFDNTQTKNKATDISELNCYFKTLLEQHSSHAELIDNIKKPLVKLTQQFQEANSDASKLALIKAINSQIVRDAGTGFVVFPSQNKESKQINLYYTFIDQLCADQASLECASNTQLAKSLWSLAGNYRALNDQLNQDFKSDSLAFNNKLAKQWQYYNNDTIKLWPQELLLNSLIYKPSQRGLSSPPNYKLLTLRPSIGLSYLSDQSHRIQPTLNIDLLGIYWWRPDQNHSESPGKGISASLIWDGRDNAYGLSYHHNPKWTFTLAQGSDNNVVVSMSFQLAHWLVKP